MNQPRVLILQATGTNRDPDAARAVEQADGQPVILHINALKEKPARLHDFAMLILPGGFSYGDALGAGRLLASDLRWLFQDELARFVEVGKPVLGICNGFQALVKSGWLPGPPPSGPLPRLTTGEGEVSSFSREMGEGPGMRALNRATLTRNASNRFECRWVLLEPDPDSPCVFTRGLAERIYCPVAHGEGRFVSRDEAELERLRAGRQIALTYTRADDGPVSYPDNPNGSVANIAGICNERGNVLGLMPHPEDHTVPWQHPHWTRDALGRGYLGLPLFEKGVQYAADL